MQVDIEPSTAKTAIQPGVIFGLLMVLEFVIFYVMDIDPISNPEVGIITNILNFLIFPLTFIYMGCISYKNANYGYITFSQCLKVGVTTSIIAALIYSLFSAAFSLIFPEFTQEILSKTRMVLETQPGMTDDMLNTSMEMTEKMMNPAITIPVTLLMYAFIGLILSLIIGAIVKKDKNQSSF